MEDLKLVQMVMEKYNMDMFTWQVCGIKSDFLVSIEKYLGEDLDVESF